MFSHQCVVTDWRLSSLFVSFQSFLCSSVVFLCVVTDVCSHRCVQTPVCVCVVTSVYCVVTDWRLAANKFSGKSSLIKSASGSHTIQYLGIVWRFSIPSHACHTRPMYGVVLFHTMLLHHACHIVQCNAAITFHRALLFNMHVIESKICLKQYLMRARTYRTKQNNLKLNFCLQSLHLLEGHI